MPIDRSLKNDLILRAARGETTERTPVWLMRQAGRTDPEYLKMRDGTGLPLQDLFRHPEWATRITMLPWRFGVDALILFQDILTILTPMGAPFVLSPGPCLEVPMDTPKALAKLEECDIPSELDFVGEALDGVREAVNGALPVLGFAGAPLTLLVFILEGGSFGTTAPRAQAFLREHPNAAHAALDKLTRMTIDYLHHQIAHGAAMVQLFESAAFLLDAAQYREFALPYQQRIFAALKDAAPTINFARDWNDIDDLAAAGADIISLPAGISITAARNHLGANCVLQGNLDNVLLMNGPLDRITEATEACLREGQHRGHIFNLSHGLLRETPFEHVLHVIDTVRNFRAD